jgi:hypothetical protein
VSDLAPRLMMRRGFVRVQFGLPGTNQRRRSGRQETRQKSQGIEQEEEVFFSVRSTRSFSPPSRSSDHREVFTWFKLGTKH